MVETYLEPLAQRRGLDGSEVREAMGGLCERLGGRDMPGEMEDALLNHILSADVDIDIGRRKALLAGLVIGLGGNSHLAPARRRAIDLRIDQSEVGLNAEAVKSALDQY